MMMPVILIFLVVVMLLGVIGAIIDSAFAPAPEGGSGVNYDEATFQHAADAKYAEYFKAGNTYEDNILLYILVDESCEGQIYAIAWVGDNIRYEINNMFGADQTEFGRSLNNNIPNYYAYSLDSNLAAVVNEMQAHIEALGLDSSFKKEPAVKANSSESKLMDLTYRTSDGGRVETDPQLTASTVNDALAAFTETTGIRTVIAVDYIDNVFVSNDGGCNSVDFTAIFAICAIVFLVVVVIAVNSKNKKEKRDR